MSKKTKKAPSKEDFVDLRKTRFEEQKKVMEQIQKDKVCPFCQENLRKYHKKKILKKGKYWILTFNQWPYSQTKQHLLAISTKHAETVAELSNEAGKELIKLLKWVEKEYKVESGGIAMRFGDFTKNGSTVNHLHVQIIVPDLSDYGKEGYKPLKFKIG